MSLLNSPLNWNPLAISGFLLLLLAYLYWNRFRVKAQSIFFFAGIAIILFAVTAPMGPGPHQHLFSAHMVMHMLLLMVAPPLLMAGIPAERVRPILSHSYVRRIIKGASKPFLAWTVGVGAMWFWHIPEVFNYMGKAMMGHGFLAFLLPQVEIASLVICGIIFCLPVLCPVKEYRLQPLSGAGYLASACMGCSALGVSIAFASPGLYHTVFNSGTTYVWGLNQTEDQQLGGLLMWIPGCMLYVTGILIILYNWLTRSNESMSVEKDTTPFKPQSRPPIRRPGKPVRPVQVNHHEIMVLN